MKAALFSATILEYGGGLEKYLVETAANLSKNSEINVDVVTMDEAFMEKLVSALSIFYLKKINKSLSFKENTKDIQRRLGTANYYKENSIRNLRKRLNNYDVIYSKNELLESFLFKLLIRYGTVPPIVFGGHTALYYPNPASFHAKLHNYLYTGPVYKILASGVRKFHALNSEEEKLYKKLFPKREIRKIYNPFDMQAFASQAKENQYRLKLNQDAIKILWLGRLTEQKGIRSLATTIEQVNNELPNAKKEVSWSIAGDGEERVLVEGLANKFPNVHYLKHVEQKYTASVYSQHQIFLSTSRWEGYPYTLLEAMSLGLQIIAYDIPGPADILKSYQNGHLAKNQEEMVKLIIK